MVSLNLSTSKFKIIFVLITVHHVNLVLSDESQNDSLINATGDNFNYDEVLKNDSVAIILFNQTDSLNGSIGELSNMTTDTNFTKTDPVVTEDWRTPETTENNQKYLSFTTSDEEICSCDLTSNFCDINCCCDSDCTDENLKVFSKCEYRPLVPDKNYCYQKDIILRNNTIYKIIKDPESSLFCIVHDNLKEHLRFKDQPIIKSHRDLDALLKYQSKNIPSWNSKDDKGQIEWREIRAGNPIIKVKQKDKIDKNWNLPSSCFNQLCSCSAEIHYLEDFTSSCNQPITNLEEECKKNPFLAANTYTDFCISPRYLSPDINIRLTDLVSHTKSYNSTEKLGLVAKCLDKIGLQPYYESSLKLCLNVVSAVHFILVHDGFNGIKDIQVHHEYVNIGQNDKTFVQHFKVDFEWNNITEAIKKSGNPGYQVGLPILLGTNSSSELDDSFSIVVQSGGLDVIGVSPGGLCIEKRRTVKFGKNLQAHCNLKYGKFDCKSLQDSVCQALLGSTRKQIFIAVFGNANYTNNDDWIEAYHEDREAIQNEDECYITTDLKINIAFAAVGTVVNPQFKIIGVGYHYNKPGQVDLSCKNFCPGLALSTSVSFFDVTEPAIPHYPKVPSIKANLPSDFFYPFIKGKANCVLNHYLVIFMCLISLLIFK